MEHAPIPHYAVGLPKGENVVSDPAMMIRTPAGDRPALCMFSDAVRAGQFVRLAGHPEWQVLAMDLRGVRDFVLGSAVARTIILNPADDAASEVQQGFRVSEVVAAIDAAGPDAETATAPLRKYRVV